ncbi:hypothetical protein [Streptomyces sp. NPDC048002]|uniref:hypothetical protein n=1 Tax=unclassified Streptomyces TaxID=2593676 RepID=UPI0033E760D7
MTFLLLTCGPALLALVLVYWPEADGHRPRRTAQARHAAHSARARPRPRYAPVKAVRT